MNIFTQECVNSSRPPPSRQILKTGNARARCPEVGDLVSMTLRISSVGKEVLCSQLIFAKSFIDCFWRNEFYCTDASTTQSHIDFGRVGTWST